MKHSSPIFNARQACFFVIFSFVLCHFFAMEIKTQEKLFGSFKMPKTSPRKLSASQKQKVFDAMGSECTVIISTRGRDIGIGWNDFPPNILVKTKIPNGDITAINLQNESFSSSRDLTWAKAKIISDVSGLLNTKQILFKNKSDEALYKRYLSSMSPTKSAYSKKVLSSYQSLRNASDNVLRANAAAEKLPKNKINEKLISDVTSMNKDYDDLVAEFASFIIAYSEHGIADKDVLSFIENQLNGGQDFFSERLLLEINRQKNLITNEEYQLKRREIVKRHCENIPLDELPLDSEQLEVTIGLVCQELNDLRKDVSDLRKTLKEWLPITFAFAFPFLMYLMSRRMFRLARKKDQRDAEEFALLLQLREEELTKKNIQLDLLIEEKNKELDKSTENEKIVIARW